MGAAQGPLHGIARAWGRPDFEWDAENDQYVCPEGQTLKQVRRTYSDPNPGPIGEGRAKYRALKLTCQSCPSEQQCCPNMDFRSIAREHHEDALQIVRDIAKARRQKIPIKLRKKVEMLSQRRERTPGQYRKDIRPLETRRLALQARAPISSVAFDVGDESPAHFSLPGFTSRDITAWKREIAELSGIRFVGVSAIA